MTYSDNNEFRLPIPSQEDAQQFAESILGIKLHAMVFAIVMPALYILNYIVVPQFIWAHIVALAWGVGLALHIGSIAVVYRLFDPKTSERWQSE